MKLTIKYNTNEPKEGLERVINNLLEYEGFFITEYVVVEYGDRVTVETTYRTDLP